MRHRVQKTTFSRQTKHRQAMLRNGLRALFEHGQLQTSKAKAKEYQRWADKLINRAQAADLTARRQLHQFFGKRDVVNTLVDKIGPVFKQRQSGFTRIVPVGVRRGDNQQLVKLELVEKPAQLGFEGNGQGQPPQRQSKKTTQEKKS